MKIGLGTAQFGADYGISNQQGKTGDDDIKCILDYAVTQGINILDTASLYGDSESVLGKVLLSAHQFLIVTKTPHFETKVINLNHAQLLKGAFRKSLTALHQPSIYGLLIHSADDLLKPGAEYLFDAIQAIKESELVKKIGVSVYNAKQIDNILKKFEIDLIQLPINVFDQRLLKSGHLKALKNANIEIHARSVFLQGLLLMEQDNIPEYFFPIKEHISKYYQHINMLKMTPLEAALNFILSVDEIDIALCGVNNMMQLKEILVAVNNSQKEVDFSNYALDESAFVNPSNWRI